MFGNIKKNFIVNMQRKKDDVGNDKQMFGWKYIHQN